MTQLNAAETKFFESRGREVDASLTGADPSPPDSGSASAPAAQAAPASPPAPASAPASAAPAADHAPAQPPAADPNAPPKGYVPQDALHAERQRRQQTEQQFNQLREQFNQLQQMLEQAAQPADERPDPQADPYGALEWDNRQLRAQMEALGKRFGEQEESGRRHAQMQQLTRHLTASERQFATTQTDYFQAADFAIKREDLRLQAFYPDPAVRQQIMRDEIAGLVTRAAQSGVNPAQLIYQHAINMGYTRAQAAPAAAPVPTAAAPTAAPVIPPTVAEAQATIARGLQQQSRSGSGGSTPPSEMTPEMLLAMDGEEFQKNWNKAFGKR